MPQSTFNIQFQGHLSNSDRMAFIINYSDDRALVHPGQIPGIRQEKLLPSSETKIKVALGLCVISILVLAVLSLRPILLL